MESIMSKRITPEFFDYARRIAAEERAKGVASFFAAIARKLHSLFETKALPADVHLRFHRGGLWRGI
jgi:hypothetical protein